MLNVYSRARDGETLLSRSFRAKEFACKDGTDPSFSTGKNSGTNTVAEKIGRAHV